MSKELTLNLRHATAFLNTDDVCARARQFSGLLADAADGMPAYAGSTGWLDVRRWAGDDAVSRIEEKARRIRNDADAFVLIGVGGSNNAARSVIEALCPGRGPEIIYAGNSTASSAMERVLRRMTGKSVYVNVIAKNFETLEPGAAFRIIRTRMYARYGAAAARRIMATGTRGSRLHALSDENGWDFLTFPDDVGGRYSALTDVGLLPMAVAGADIRALVDGAVQMRETLLHTPAEQNPALLYAAARTLLYEQGFRVEVLSSFEPAMSWFSKWWIQLFSESEGKAHKGLFPSACLFSEELHSMGQFLQDGTRMAFETFLHTSPGEADPALTPDGVDDGFDYLNEKRFSELNEAAYTASLTAHAQSLPCLELRLGEVDERMFGGLFYFFELACAFSCRMTGVHPFDQPGVEDYKKRMFAALGKEC